MSKNIFILCLFILLIIACVWLYIVWNRAKHALMQNKLLMEEVEKNSQAAIKEARAKTEFVANMSHEIRVPMNAISCATDILLKEDLPYTTKSYLNVLKSSSDSLLEMINGILDFSKMDAGRLSLIETEYSVRDVIEDVKSIVTAKLSDKPLAFTIDVAPGLPKTLIGDQVRIKQMLINLLNNAVRYTSEGKISFKVDFERLSKETLDLFLTVSDTGNGMPDLIKESIASYLSDNSANADSASEVGRGLSMVKSLANLMGGNVTFESENGKGTAFHINLHQKMVEFTEPIVIEERGRGLNLDVLIWEDNIFYRDNLSDILKALSISTRFVSDVTELRSVLCTVKIDYVLTTKNHFDDIVDVINKCSPATIPVKIVELDEPVDASFDGNFVTLKRPIDIFQIVDIFKTKEYRELHASDNAGKLSAPRAKILLVDDNKVNLKVAKSLLATFGSTIVAVDSGEKAVAEIEAGEHFDLIFMDHMMPGMDGIETAHKIWELQGNEKTAVIALTANAGLASETLFLEAGMSDFIPKPIIMKNLTYVMQKWLPKDKQEYSESSGIESSPFIRMHAKAFQPEWGLSRVWDDKKLFCETLKLFLEHRENFNAQMEEADSDESKERLIEQLYKLSVAIGAVRLPEMINDLKYAIRSGNAELLVAKAGKFTEECDIVCDEVKKYLEKEDVDELALLGIL